MIHYCSNKDNMQIESNRTNAVEERETSEDLVVIVLNASVGSTVYQYALKE